jgi:hypothetical protein
MEIQGKIIKVLAPVGGVSKAGKEWKKQDFVVEMGSNTQYPKRIAFNIFGEDKIQQYALREGENVSVKFEIDSHEYNGRWFNEVRAWEINKLGGQQMPPQQGYQQPQYQPQPTPASYGQTQQMYGGAQNYHPAQPQYPPQQPQQGTQQEEALPF